ncbi:MAG: universal stress protein [Dermatophilaceae bacterium]|nr:universal stress protein [Dermatophilaceae bacterium]
MSTQQITQGSVVVGVDGSPASDAALRWAVSEARRTQQPLHAVHAQENELVLNDKEQLGTKEAPASADPVLTSAGDVVRTMAPEVQLTLHSVTGFAPTTLTAASRLAQTVVVGSHGRSALPTALLGSVSHQVAIHSRCPVVVVRENGTQGVDGPGKVIVGVDGSAASEPALAYAFAYASSTGSGLTAVHTWWWEPLEGVSLGEPWLGDWTQIATQESSLVAEVLAGWAHKFPDVSVTSHVVRGDPVVELLEQSRGARLLVVGSRGRGGFIGLMLGSVSRRVLKRATCPVAVVRSAGGDNPAG